MKGNFKATSALTLVSDPQFSTAVEKLPKLQKLVEEQLDAVARMERDAALHAIVIGLTLHRIKASLKYGEFGKWIAKNIEKKKSQVNNYMRLALVFLEQSGVTKPDLLALPGESFDLVVAGESTAKRLFKKAVEFVGDRSLNEILVEHDIKNAGAGGSSSSGATGSGTGEDPLLSDIASYLMGLREIFCTPDSFKRIPAAQRKDAVRQLASILEEARKLESAAR